MLWKPEYKLGNELVDTQHERLFNRVAALNEIIESEDAASRKEECISAILFLKDYAVKHFAAEEAFQESRNYRFREFHKAIHSSFVTSVLEAEEKLVESDFSVPVIKEFCGFLSMWLVYHVAGADQKIVKDDVMTVAEFAISVSYEDCVLESMKDVFGTVIGDNLDMTISWERMQIPNAILVEIDYDEKRVMRFVLPKATALAIVESVTDLHLHDVDELAHSVLVQFAKTICGNAYNHMEAQRRNADDTRILPDELIESGDFFINTKFGKISISLVKK